MSFFRSFSQVLKTRNEQDNSGGNAAQPTSKGQAKGGKPTAQNKGVTKQKPSKPAAAAKVAAQQPAPAQSVAKSEASEAEAKKIISQAQEKARQVLVEAKSEALKLRDIAEKKADEMEEGMRKQQSSLDRQLESLNNRLDQIEKREKQLDKRWEDFDRYKQELEERRQKLIDRLADVAGMTAEQARQELFTRLEREVNRRAATMVAERVAKAESEAEDKSQDILIDAMKHGATDYVVEYTMSSMQLDNQEMKGRIIGKEGRNIRAFERATGVEIELDEADEVRLSSFDPVRREVARQTLLRLMKDGRIQPARIEEVVARVEKDLQKSIFEEGKRLAHRFKVYDLPTEVLEKLGRFKYRFSYGQNMIHHVIECTQMGRKLAQELKLDVRTVTLGCLLHDIGKVLDGEGSHVQLGVQFLKRHKLPEGVVAAVAQHHEDEPFTSAESVIVHIADAISGARPGARNENREEYVQRLSEMEEIATAHDGVNRAFAIQAGRELRVILNPDKTADRDIQVIAQKIAQQIQDEMQYPGTVTVNAIRELRASAMAS